MSGMTGMRAAAWRGGLVIGVLLLAGCSSTQRQAPPGAEGAQASPVVRGYKLGKPYQIKGVWYYPEVDYNYVEEGVASWYGPGFHGKQTANGETYDMNDLTAAHRTLPMPSVVRVTNLENGRSIKLKVNDRGPFAREQIIDVSRRASQLLGFHQQGTTPVRVEIVEDESRMLAAALGVPSEVAWAAAYQTPTVMATVVPAAAAVPPPVVAPAATVVAAEAPSGYVETATAADATEPAVAPAYADAAAVAADPVVASSLPIPEAALDAPATAPADPGPVPAYYGYGTSYAAYTPIATPTDAPLVKPAATARAVAKQSAAGGGEVHWVQAGAFADPGRAAAARRRLASFGPTVTSPSMIAGRSLLRVRVGPLYSEAEARQVLASVSRAGFPESRIVDD